ncbi:hypothetical protein Dfri01_64640 [Dyadobacter frigoris]|uniref:PAS domain-containing sensor histidine kinase n=1 Tax=Dyadobacter frigoris TaxID=2576211 RepID=UPI0024A036B0|nr:PAS domain-containing protein [Dyadobacter frigoris]GLU57003.1 hypothetical protein Dfri01_64640 [Dyadobacter frigoris]
MKEKYKLFNFEAAGVTTWEFDLIDNNFSICDSFKEMIGHPLPDTVAFDQLLEQIHPDDQNLFVRQIKEATTSGSAGLLEIEFRSRYGKPDGDNWIYCKGVTTYDQQNHPNKLSGIALDVTKQVRDRLMLQSSEECFRNLVEHAPVATCLFIGRQMLIEYANKQMISYWGKGRSVIGKPLTEALPEMEGQPFMELIDQVFITGKACESKNMFTVLEFDGIRSEYCFNFTYRPLMNIQGNVYAVIGTAVDVTSQVLAQKELDDVQRQIFASYEQSPVAIAVIRASDLTFMLANSFYGQLVGRYPSQLVGRKLLEALPELDGQGFEQLLEKVALTGETHASKERMATIVRSEKLKTIFIDFTYQLQKDNHQNNASILVTAVDVTEQVLSRNKIQEAEISLRGAVELANLGTWQIDLTTGTREYSTRLKNWYNIDESEIITKERAYACIRLQDRSVLSTAINKATTPGGSGLIDVEYVLDALQCGKERILHAIGRTYFNETGAAIKISGLVQDVTGQRKVQTDLRDQVEQRTQQLATANQELAVINQQLTESNDKLLTSNDNLQQFAFIASHDLQEPLRKIQSFGNLLSKRYSAELGEGLSLLTRMQAASKRMSVLIEDLLVFSRVSSSQDRMQPVSLNAIVNIVLSDLDLLISETGASVITDILPEISGDSIQLTQLFQNLLNNALKFRHPQRPAKSGLIPPLLQAMICYLMLKQQI